MLLHIYVATFLLANMFVHLKRDYLQQKYYIEGNKVPLLYRQKSDTKSLSSGTTVFFFINEIVMLVKFAVFFFNLIKLE